MIDAKKISENVDEIIKQMSKRKGDFSYLRKVVVLSENRKKLIDECENLKQQRNIDSKKIGELINRKEEKQANLLKQNINVVKEKIEIIENELISIENEIKIILDTTPNLPYKNCPEGDNEDDNVEIRKWKEPIKFENVKPHWEIATSLDIVDFERATKLSGSRFIMYKGLGTRLERALFNFMLDQHGQRGYTEILPPTLVKDQIMYGTGQLPKFKDEAYYIEKDNLFLIPTAEVPLICMYYDEILDETKLPLYYCAYTQCYRQEAGSAGKDTRGIIRLHQFNKVELVKFSKPEDSFNELEKLTNDAEHILQMLEIPYRVIELCTADLGFSASKTYDIELWMPYQDKYREVSSCSNCTDFQARRAKIRYRNQNGKNVLVHTLNGSGLALDRVMAAILENFQQPDGSVLIPKVLVPYLDGITKIDVSRETI